MAKDTKLDFNFDLPPGVSDMSYKDFQTLGAFDEEEVNRPDEFDGSDSDAGGVDTDNSAGEEGRVLPPSYMNVISQSAKTLKGGGQVIDVIVEFPDLNDGHKYEMRVTKA